MPQVVPSRSSPPVWPETTQPLPIIIDRTSDTIDNDEGDPDSSSDEEDEDGVPFVPSQDIKNASKLYPIAPNPCISIDGFGPLGLPLSRPEANRLIGVCTKASSTTSEYSEEYSQDAWELEALKVQFTHPEWQNWIDRTVVPAVLEVLGVDSWLVHAQFSKLLVFEAGSHFESDRNMEQASGAFASMIISLPSAYTGASLRVSHAGQTKVIDVSSSSATTPSVSAWYHEAVRTGSLVSSGYRLVLSYSLVIPQWRHATRPLLPQTADAVNRLRHVLLSWCRDASGKAPTKLVYLLNRQYTISDGGASSLEGSDAHLVNFLGPVAEKLRVRVYLANLELSQYGPVKRRILSREERWGSHWPHIEDEELPANEEGHREMAEVESSSLHVEETLFDLGGDEVELDGIEVNENGEMIPTLLSEGPVDEETYDSWYGGTVTYDYRRTAIIIYPAKNESKVCAYRDPVEFSLERLKAKIERGWRPKDLRSKHIGIVLEASGGEHVSRALSILCKCAALGDDMALWMRAVRACDAVQRIARLGIPGFLEGIKLFGLDGLRSLFEDVMLQADDNSLRSSLANALVKESQQYEQEGLRQWAIMQQRYVGEHLKPLAHDDIALLVEIAQARGLLYFSDIILPQVVQLRPDTSILNGLIRRIRCDSTRWPSQDDILLQQITRRLMTLMLAADDYLSFYYLTRSDCSRLIEVVKLCEAVNLLALLAPVIDRAVTSFEVQSQTYMPEACTDFLLPFLAQLEAASAKSQRLRTEFSMFMPFFNLLRFVFQYGMSAKGFPNVMPILMRALPRAGRISDIQAMLAPHIAALAKQNLAVLKLFAVELYRIRDTLSITIDEELESLRDVLHQLVAAIVANTSIKTMGRDQRRHIDPAAPSVTPIEMIQYCLSFGDHSLVLCRLVTDRVQPPADSSQLASWFHDWLCPFIDQLRNLLTENALKISMEPFRDVLSRGICAFVDLGVGQKPPRRPLEPRLSSFGCGCSPCADFQCFMLGTGQVYSCVGSPARKHLEKYLLYAGAADAGLTWVTEYGRPYELKVTKPDHMVAPDRWHANARLAVTAISSLGDVWTQQTILGDALGRILGTLGLPIPPTLKAKNPGGSISNGATSLSDIPSTGNSETSNWASLAPSAKRRMSSPDDASRDIKRAKVNSTE